MGNSYGTRWRGKLPVPRHAHPLVRQFFGVMNRQKTTISEVAARSGQQRGTISDWRYRRNPTIDNFEAALNALDLTLCIRKRQDDHADH